MSDLPLPSSKDQKNDSNSDQAIIPVQESGTFGISSRCEDYDEHMSGSTSGEWVMREDGKYLQWRFYNKPKAEVQYETKLGLVSEVLKKKLEILVDDVEGWFFYNLF
jgi:hypothetical protein